MNPLIAFITGLTAGGLSCLSIQAGLLASSIGDQAKDDIEEELSNAQQSGAEANPGPKPARHILQPVTLFLAARLTAYTILGFLLGWVGTALQLTPYTRAAMLIIVGIFMLGTALRMLNVHPIFRHFVIEPPKKVTRYMRKKAKNDGAHTLTPVLLGTLTVLIPCGISQVMMAAAIASGNPITGASIMFAFILGTSPIFFGLAFMTAKLTGRMQTGFLKFIGIVIFILAFVSINSGLNLAGSPLSFSNIKQSLSDKQALADNTAPANNASPATQSPPAQSPAASTSQPSDNATDTLKLITTSYNYTPQVIRASANKAYKLEITSKNNTGCGRAFTIPSMGKQEILPENGVTTINIPPQQPGKMRMTCAMGMFNAVIEFS